MPTGVCGCSPVPMGVTVSGRVTDPSGVPVRTAFIVAELVETGCSGQRRELASAQTNANGDYSVFIEAHSPEVWSGCVRVRADPPAGSLWLASNPIQVPLSAAAVTAHEQFRVDLALRSP
jgi:hypothetical protein